MSTLVEIANFQILTDAQMAQSLLRVEGIECMLMNEYTTQVFGGCSDIWGVSIEVLDNDADRAVELLADSGYEECITYKTDEYDEAENNE